MPGFGQILGIEGTAWNLSAAVFDTDLVSLFSKPYSPPAGGIHPREAAQHHAQEMKGVISRVLTDPGSITGVAFSQGPGLGPCLRTVATAARSLSIALGVPLVGVNHCVAHIEIGRFATGCHDPIVLYASGANTQVIGYLNRRYRIFGETLDIGIGNALDKYARSMGLPHPGGPAIEELARGGAYIHLPYTVKGMDLAFSGLVSAARESAAAIADVCYSLQETAFAMCVEVTERALAHTGKDEVLLVGGVGANRRIQEMLATMCEDRGATLFVPENRYLGDNGAMIAYTGKIMLESGSPLPLERSQVNPSFRPDQVEVTWRDDDPSLKTGRESLYEMTRAMGAEAVVTLGPETVRKHRVSKRYRKKELDSRLIAERTRAEARLIAMARKSGVPTPVIRDVTADTLVMERIYGNLLRDDLSAGSLREAGRTVGRLHAAGIVHGDLTTSNMVLRDGAVVLIDFGLAMVSSELESRGVDIHVLFQTLESTTDRSPVLKEAFSEGYEAVFNGAREVLSREQEIERRGRYL
ncbi:MAG TPA: bifunctional N(6)-L-threonylcarbamoyladenine synthase/serine/threonine protein kinase [Methanoregulaceae archaeon]|nr:MAG: bifunctional N(6)-L-threonylcarbamoyladenine synthase/serine/threonine protein kinase [Methanolinea sp.]HON81812.1 bifunctional N(6)-L-threonylcarbamoyladenine synthase/serine/threonine protein kinase [Methanoregulaceae archaeon]HPD10842.1 bifunctional N(6)-L-threonylcarbamoyladenine synthase/serine/threonine protein kinase [Methanoregulaceae archaeon]HRT15638.1 bifunctional N(6)-L-threonylcarbamoyladenine synthase/serine/threonine protein kinase [Methanoregulaceae archaeon]HRU31523.1 b